MSSRQEEKQRRREERMERERKEQAAAARRKRLQLALGGLAGVAAIAVVVVLIAGGLNGDASGGGEGDGPQEPTAEGVSLPPQQIGDVEEAAEAAGCELTSPEIEGAGHEEREFTADDYDTNPPTSGPHNPVWYQDGVYEPGTTPRLGELVHTLEHGRINVQYAPGTPEDVVEQLEAFLVEQSDGYHMLLYENTTGMDAQIAATTWGQSLTCPEMNPEVIDALRTFRTAYIDQGPENVP